MNLPQALPHGPIVFFGDSTTAPRSGVETCSEKLAGALEKEGREVRIVNAGVPGNSTAMARERFECDVLSQNPSLTVIQFGINDAAVDVWKRPPATAPRVSLAEYRGHLGHFIDELHRNGSRVILMTPNRLCWTPKLRERYGGPPYRPEDEDGLNVVLDDYAAAVRELAEQKRLPLVDVAAEYRKRTAAEVQALLPDGMHPNSAGHDLVYRLLKREILQA